MPDNKLTDNEIIKALEICSTKGASCKDCPAFVKVDRSNCNKVLLGAIDLINRLQAENEKYKHNNNTLVDGAMIQQKIFNSQQDEINRLRCIILSFMQEMYEWSNKNNIDTTNFSLIPILESEKESLVKQLKAEAYKEFAEKLKKHAYFEHRQVVAVELIDNLLKELVGEK